MNIDHFISIVSPLSITSKDNISRLFYELEHIRLNQIDGDLVECGVYKGGNILGMMEYCHFFNLKKNIWLYDTFSGMTQPQKIDIDHNNMAAVTIFDQVKCEESLDNVKRHLSKSEYSPIYLRYIIGDVCDTLKDTNNIPSQIALLRLDTDWYESTMCELKTLFPKVVKQGSVIIDDYGHWQGCRKAVDEFFTEYPYHYKKIDYTAIYLHK